MLEQLSKRYDNKPVWVTEFACPAWIGGTFGKNGLAAQYCDASRHEATMRQLLPQLDAADYVFRYSWYLNRDDSYVYNDGECSPLWPFRSMLCAARTLSLQSGHLRAAN